MMHLLSRYRKNSHVVTKYYLHCTI